MPPSRWLCVARHLAQANAFGVAHILSTKEQPQAADMTPPSWLYGRLKCFRAGV